MLLYGLEINVCLSRERVESVHEKLREDSSDSDRGWRLIIPDVSLSESRESRAAIAGNKLTKKGAEAL